MAGPKTPPRPTFQLVDPGSSFEDIPKEDQDAITRDVEDYVRSPIFKLAQAISDAGPALRVARTRLRRRLSGLSDSAVIPLRKSSKFKGADDLTKAEVIRLLDALARARQEYFSEPQQDLYSRVAGDLFDTPA